MKQLLFILVLLTCTPLLAQEDQQSAQDTIPDAYLNPYKYIPKLKVFLDCPRCDHDFIQQTLDYRNFVRDQKFADVHVIVRTQITGSGGEEHELEFLGKGDFKDIYHKTKFATSPTNSFSENRDLMLSNIGLGLVSFGSKHYDKYEHVIEEAVKQGKSKDTTSTSSLTIPTIPEDKWNNWVFNVGMNGSLNGQETSQNYSLGGNLSAKRVTKKNKFLFRANYNYRESKFELGDFDVTSFEKSVDFNIYDAFSLTKHWSLGAFLDAGSSTFENRRVYVSFKPAIEYSFFDYKEAAKKQITLSYRIGGINNSYFERTIFNKEKEFIWEHTLELSGSVRQSWGGINGSIVYDSFLNDASFHALNFRASTNFRVTSGLSFNVSGNYNITKNQINLAGGDLSLEELLLRQQQVQSGYNFFISIGFNYSFGSVFSSIVNPRFDF